MTDESADLQALSRSINTILILGVLRDEEKHGYQIALDVSEVSRGLFELQHGTLYPVLHKMEKEGWISGRWSAKEGRRRKVYRITPEGRRYLRGEADRFEVLAESVLRVIRGPDRATS